MVHEFIRLFRLYCDLTPEMVAEVTDIPLFRYKNIEMGEIEPSENEAAKLAKLFNVDASELLCGISDLSKYTVHQEIDDGMFATDEIKQVVKLKITELSPKEKKLILLIRNSDNSEKSLDDAINTILEK